MPPIFCLYLSVTVGRAAINPLEGRLTQQKALPWSLSSWMGRNVEHLQPKGGEFYFSSSFQSTAGQLQGRKPWRKGLAEDTAHLMVAGKKTVIGGVGRELGPSGSSPSDPLPMYSPHLLVANGSQLPQCDHLLSI